MNEHRFMREAKTLLDSAENEGLREEVLMSWIESLAKGITLDEAYKKLTEAYFEWVK